MKKFLKPQYIIFTLIIIALSILNVRSCNKNKDLNVALTEARLENQTLDSIKNAKQQTIYTQTAIVTNQQAEIARLSQEKFDLTKKNERLVKKVLAYQSETTETRIDSVDVPFVDTVERKKFSDSVEKACREVIDFYEDNYIKVPRVAKDSTTNYQIDISTTKTGNVINSLIIPDSNYFRIIEKKGGFFRKVQVREEDGSVKKKLRFYTPRTIEFQSFHTNPLVHVTGQTSVYYVPKKKGKWIGQAILLGTGIYLGTKL